MYSLSFAAAFTMPEAVAAFIFKDRTRKVHALKKKIIQWKNKKIFFLEKKYHKSRVTT